MATVLQNLNKIMMGNVIPSVSQGQPTLLGGKDEVLYSTNDKADYEAKLASLKQQKLLSYQWVKANADVAMDNLANYSAIKLMYRDADLMMTFPELYSALQIVAGEATCLNSKGRMLNIYSSSPRVKAILEDLFVNRLHINTTLPMITFDTLKYGNCYELLKISLTDGILDWKKLPVYEMVRNENSVAYGGVANVGTNTNDLKPDKLSFTWEGHNNDTPYANWEIAHFRLLDDGFFLPYGCIVGDTRIETEDGFKEIDTINIGDKVWTFDVEKQEKVLATVSMGAYKGIKDVYSVKTRHNYIEATDDHNLLCYENGELVYKPVSDIKIGDLLVIDNSKEKQNNAIKIDKSDLKETEANLKKSTQWWSNNINRIPDYVDEEFAEFFGFMLGDGWIDTNDKVSFATGEYDSINKRFADYLHRLTGNKLRYCAPYQKCNYEIAEIQSHSKCLSIILHRMGFYGKFDSKRIPAWVYSANDTIKRAFLRGIMTADGSYHIDKYGVLRCSIEMANEQLIKDIKVLVQSLGYKSGQISSRDRRGNETVILQGKRSIKTKHTTYYFYYFESENKQEKKYDLINRKNNGFKTETVRSKDFVGKKKTYDITVDNDNSNFFANGIVTHNCSYLHKARRAWRMLSMMEDAMLLYRLERSVERRVFKVFVGGIDDADVGAFVQEVANKFKRTPIIDPATGQIDLRQNYIPVNADYFIPVRNENAASPIETLQPAQNPTIMDDMNYMRDKIMAAMLVPKTFLNFQEAQGKGQNLSLMDIRFCRMVNKVQQFLLLELNKVAMVHLYILGMHDDLTNFTLSMNNPSAQIEALELEDIQKRLNVAQVALADPGNGMPILSLHKVLKEIMKMSDKEIKDMLNEVRLEKAIANELAGTPNVIKKTGIFDIVDNIYGEPNVTVPAPAQGEEGGPSMGGGPGGGGDVGGSLSMDSLGGAAEDTGGGGDIGGAPSEGGMAEAPAMDSGGGPMPLQEVTLRKQRKSMIKEYFDMLDEAQKKESGDVEITYDYIGKNNILINEIKDNIDKLISAEEQIENNSDMLEEALYKLKGGEDIEVMEEE